MWVPFFVLNLKAFESVKIKMCKYRNRERREITQPEVMLIKVLPRSSTLQLTVYVTVYASIKRVDFRSEQYIERASFTLNTIPVFVTHCFVLL